MKLNNISQKYHTNILIKTIANYIPKTITQLKIYMINNIIDIINIINIIDIINMKI